MSEIGQPTVQEYTDAAGAGEFAAAWSIAQGFIARGITLPVVLRDLIGRSQEMVGERWQTGAWTVATEHSATAVTGRVIAELVSGVATPPDGARQVLVACAEGEWHSVGATMAGAALRYHGYDVIQLPPGTTSGQLTAAIHDIGPAATIVVCVMPALLTGARRQVVASQDAGTPAVVIGRAFGDNAQRANLMGADAWAPDLVELGSFVDAVQGFSRPSRRLDHQTSGEYSVVRQETGAITERMRSALAEVDDPDAAVSAAVWLLRALSASLLLGDRTVFEGEWAWLLSRQPLTGVSAIAVVQALAGAMPDSVPHAQATIAAASVQSSSPSGGK